VINEGDTAMRTLREIVDPDPLWVPADMPLERVAEALAERGLNAVPVCTPNGRIVGVLSKTDLTELYGRGVEQVARDAMTPEVLSVKADEPLDAAIRKMAFEGVHQLIVIDEVDRFVGVITSMDVLRELAGFGREPPRIIAVAL
jgi:predicted transcriptional regulator